MPSNFSKTHGLATFQERKEAKIRKGGTQYMSKWLTADHIVDQVYCDKLNGLSTSEIVVKFAACKYDGQKKPIGQRTALDYVSAARDRLKYDYETDMKEIRSEIYGKLLALYNDSIIDGDRASALSAIDKIMKLGGMDKPQTAIQINGSDDGKVVVNFGFGNDEKDDE